MDITLATSNSYNIRPHRIPHPQACIWSEMLEYQRLTHRLCCYGVENGLSYVLRHDYVWIFHTDVRVSTRAEALSHNMEVHVRIVRVNNNFDQVAELPKSSTFQLT